MKKIILLSLVSAILSACGSSGANNPNVQFTPGNTSNSQPSNTGNQGSSIPQKCSQYQPCIDQCVMQSGYLNQSQLNSFESGLSNFQFNWNAVSSENNNAQTQYQNCINSNTSAILPNVTVSQDRCSQNGDCANYCERQYAYQSPTSIEQWFAAYGGASGNEMMALYDNQVYQVKQAACLDSPTNEISF